MTAQFMDLLAQTHRLDSATWPVIPLKLHEVTMPPRLAILTGLDASDPANWQDVIERLCREFQRPYRRPFPGLNVLTQECERSKKAKVSSSSAAMQRLKSSRTNSGCIHS